MSGSAAARRQTIVLGVGLSVALVYLFLPDGPVADWLYDGCAVFAAAAMLVGVATNRPAEHRGWWMLAAGLTTWVLGDLVYDTIVRLDLGSPYPSVADGFYLVAYPLLALGLLRLGRTRHHWATSDALLDALIIAAGVGLPVWVYLVTPAIGHDGQIERLLGTAYPIFDIVLVALLSRFLTTPGARTASFRFLAGGLTATIAADVLFAIGEYQEANWGPWAEGGFLVGYVLIAAAANSPSMRALDGQSNELLTPASRLRLAVLAICGTTPPALAFVQWLSGAKISFGPVLVCWTIVSALTMLRNGLLLRRLRRQSDVVASLARTDALTGLPNRRSIDAELGRRVGAAAKHRRALVVGVLDLDKFKSYNDRHGHMAGDALLRDAAECWQAALGPSGFVGRMGGEEFVAVWEGLSLAEVCARAEQLRDTTPDRQTVSIGLAEWDGREPQAELLDRADQALYAAKRAGRNRVVVAPSPRSAGPRRTPLVGSGERAGGVA